MSSPSSPTKGAAQPAPQTTTTTTAAAATTTSTAKTDKEKAKQVKKKVPTKPQGEKWSSSINALLADPEGVEAFRDFLVELENESGEAGEYTKYIDFYLECEEYKARFKKLEDKAKEIFEDYLAVS
ncbi:Regulator of G-protein signaling 10 [Portunus trituberculatus]|uniref:Regulator of G-protein signaling 10 n=1 Tax=Portunus trituberculatus TaxID=210409 RepID=A0A5B7JCL4_PORTR|nr:Regulator of G-protein signaling 10 [Portunus trituberculatus]